MFINPRTYEEAHIVAGTEMVDDLSWLSTDRYADA
jgi:hypothetical protein